MQLSTHLIVSTLCVVMDGCRCLEDLRIYHLVEVFLRWRESWYLGNIKREVKRQAIVMSLLQLGERFSLDMIGLDSLV